jgi:iron uptake system EfeUOB component EfeO/EfeM
MRHSTRIGAGLGLIAVLALALGAASGALAGTAQHRTATSITVTFTDKKLLVSHTGLRAGSVTFLLNNKSTKLHALMISGQGIIGQRTRTVAPGKQATMKVTLRIGAYMLSDGMQVHTQVSWLVVNPATAVSSGPNSAKPNGPSTGTTNSNSGTNGGGYDGSMACDI